ncbi:MAG: 2Fe-2S iron-sulfur cluster-binding protein, partial [Anaerolineae bacterium]
MAVCRVRFLPADREAQVPAGTLLGEAAQQAGVDINMPCGGQGRCGRCAVIVEEGPVHRLSTGRLARDDVAGGYALACQTTVEGDVLVTVPPQEKIERRLETSKRAKEVELPFDYSLQDQSLRKYVVTLDPPSLQDQMDDWSRLSRELVRRYDLEGVEVSLPVLRKLGPALRQGDWTVTVVVELDSWHRPEGPPRLIDVLPGEHLESLWAVAMDIGTTSNVVWLVDLISGRVMSQQADYNGQIARGEDVISRIIYASRHENGQEELQQLVVETFNRLVEQAAEERGISRD